MKYLLYVPLLALLLCVPLPGIIVLAPDAHAEVNTPVATSTAPVVPEIPSYVLDNCYAYVRYMIPNFPMASLVEPNTTPHIGAVAIFNYNGEPHYGIITSLNEDGFMLNDSNYGGPGIRTHFVAWGNKYIVGFWST